MTDFFLFWFCHRGSSIFLWKNNFNLPAWMFHLVKWKKYFSNAYSTFTPISCGFFRQMAGQNSRERRSCLSVLPSASEHIGRKVVVRVSPRLALLGHCLAQVASRTHRVYFRSPWPFLPNLFSKKELPCILLEFTETFEGLWGSKENSAAGGSSYWNKACPNSHQSTIPPTSTTAAEFSSLPLGQER